MNEASRNENPPPMDDDSQVHDGEIMPDVEPQEAPGGALVPVAPSAIVMPAVSVQEALESWEAYLELKQAIAKPSDVQTVMQRGQEKQFYKKSYWRKIATFFNLSVEAVEGTQVVHQLGSGQYAVSVEYKAVAPNGRTASGDGHCGTDESGKDNFMQIAGIAHTRGFNRAVSNLVGGGEVSAEEMDAVHDSPAPPSGPPARRSPQTPSSENSAGFVPQSPIKFGRCKDMFPRDISDQDLDWYIRVSEENLVNPEKQKWRAGTQRQLNEYLAEKAHRAGKFPADDADWDPLPESAPATQPAPQERPNKAGSSYPFNDMAAFLITAADAKAALGDDTYYRGLDMMNIKHANEIKTIAQGRILYDMWHKLYREHMQQGGGNA